MITNIICNFLHTVIVCSVQCAQISFPNNIKDNLDEVLQNNIKII